jgi:pimeloyl-ACP methyl ester carboxylesterase
LKTIYAIPGLGDTSEVYRNIAVAGYELKVLNWPLPQKNMSLQDYALSFLSQIDTLQPAVFIGFSFGGMLGIELAEHLKCEKVFIISSCKNSTEFPAALKMLKRLPVYRILPDALLRFVFRTARHFMGFDKVFEDVFVHMVDQMPRQYFSRCIHYIISWQRRGNTVPIVHIHGTADRLLLYKGLGKNYAVKGGSHTMILSRATDINNILNKELNGL